MPDPGNPDVLVEDVRRLLAAWETDRQLFRDPMEKNAGSDFVRVAQFLVQKLRRLNAIGHETLDQGIRGELARILRLSSDFCAETYNEPLARGIIELFERIGSQPELSVIEHATRLMPEHKALWSRARQAIDVLSSRVEMERLSRTLLRPAAPGSDADSLLRPAAEGTRETELLLRPVNKAVTR